ncbi:MULTISPECIES: phosphatase PAP2 family protein [Lactobacillus]|uniref:Phosphatase PAP2 family protein n=1 Tax=Lactobacillus xujianguonis TaxID=2495899 RepID=A0A437SWD2_9LACO|nr:MULTISPECIES: phosphatase PAP2 family protein [Lactobacillus]RVU71137.1 phosphatase PAP2 family protein [Lactobacillus xujianguonis]RVU77484.1 phosphatase PAP2 family protein [Lactobacillus xujianguonis]
MMKKNYTAIGIGLPLTLILAFSIVLHASWVNHVDHFFQQLVHFSPNLQGIMLKISFLASPKMDLVWMLIIVIILWIKHQKPLALNLLVLLISADAVGWVIKHLIQRARPIQHLAIDDGFSFPSGHTLGLSILVLWFIMIFLPVFLKNKTTRIWVDILLAVILVIEMISRVYLYAHYPTDVCGSVLVSWTWIGVVELLWQKFTPRTSKNNF